MQRVAEVGGALAGEGGVREQGDQPRDRRHDRVRRAQQGLDGGQHDRGADGGREPAAGRERDVRWGPRTLDVDVVVADPPVPPGLVVPHPRAHERAFVLAPWADLDPDAELPGHGRVADLLAAVGTDGVRRLP